MMSTMRSPAGLIAVASLLFVFADLHARGQQCPKENPDGPSQPSEARTLEGQLIYHDGIRKWFELKLVRRECGQESVQLLQGGGAWVPGYPASLETLRGCRVRTKGVLAPPSTGYYTLDLYQNVDDVEPIGECTKQPPLPDFSKAKPDKSIRSYRVKIIIDYEQADHPIFFRVTSGGKDLQPWQAYARYWLTGGYVLYGYCAEDFIVDRVFGDSEATPQHFEERGSPNDAAMFGPDDTTRIIKKKLKLGNTCIHVP
jgi:hypothetical protein